MQEARQILLEEGRRTIVDQSYVGALIGKWRELLEGIPDRNEHERYVLGCTAMLMENESQYLQQLTEETRSLNVGSFTKFIFPVLRRVFPNLIANEIVSVQPMSAPVGAVFFLDYIYGTSKGATQKGNIFPKDFDKDYSSEYVPGEQLVVGDGINYGGGGTALGAVFQWTPVRPKDATKGVQVIIREVDASTGATVQEAVDNGDGTFTFNPAGGATAGSLNYSNGALAGFKFQNIPVASNPVKVYYFYDGEMNTKVPQVQLDVKKQVVEAVPRRLKALWSSEAAEDLRAFHGLDAETEMVSAVAQEIALEIDREIVQEIFTAATTTTGTFDRVPPGGISEVDHLRSMITTISTVSGLIHKRTLRAPANFIVTSPEVSALLSQLTTHGDFRPLWVTGDPLLNPMDLPRPMTQHGQFGIYKTGTLMNKWVVYEDPFFDRDKMLVGLKGSSYLDAGYAFAPYIPLQVTPTFLDPADFSFRKGMRTRYAKRLLRPEYYGTITIQNL